MGCNEDTSCCLFEEGHHLCTKTVSFKGPFVLFEIVVTEKVAAFSAAGDTEENKGLALGIKEALHTGFGR
jgi:hypothetical protein